MVICLLVFGVLATGFLNRPAYIENALSSLLDECYRYLPRSSASMLVLRQSYQDNMVAVKCKTGDTAIFVSAIDSTPIYIQYTALNLVIEPTLVDVYVEKIGGGDK